VINDLVSLSNYKKLILKSNNDSSLSISIQAKKAEESNQYAAEKADIEMKICDDVQENNLTSKKNFSSENIEKENKNTNNFSLSSKENQAAKVAAADSNINEIKKSNEENNSCDLNNLILYNKCKIEDIGITFILPGCGMELKENGSELSLDAYNIEEYINLIFKTVCFEGISEAVKAFKKGFNLVFPIKALRCFHSFEISELICGATSEVWNQQLLFDAIVPNYGYDHSK